MTSSDAQSAIRNPQSAMDMYLTLMLPERILVDTPVIKVIAEAANGSFCLLPRHIDFVAALVPGLLAFTHPDGREEFVAVAEGVLVKQGRAVQVSAIKGVRGAKLGDLRHAVREQFRQRDEQDRRAQSALARLEADFVRRFLELGER
jgi:F-type H+-transporting ATPase subunit epsilon